MSHVPSASIPKSAKRVGLTYAKELRLRGSLRRRVPSEPWLEAQFKNATDKDKDGKPIVYRYHDPHVFPPGGANTAMLRCPVCGIFNPPNSFEHGHCLDHANHEGWGPSPSAVTIAKLQFYNLRFEEEKLPPEDVRHLRYEIRRYQTRQKRARALAPASH